MSVGINLAFFALELGNKIADGVMKKPAMCIVSTVNSAAAIYFLQPDNFFTQIATVAVTSAVSCLTVEGIYTSAAAVKMKLKYNFTESFKQSKIDPEAEDYIKKEIEKYLAEVKPSPTNLDPNRLSSNS